MDFQRHIVLLQFPANVFQIVEKRFPRQGVGDSTKRGKTSLKTQAFATKSERLPQNDPFATKMTRLPQNRGVFPSFPRFPTFCQLLIGLSRVTWSRGGGRPILKLPRALVGVGKGVRTRRKNG